MRSRFLLFFIVLYCVSVATSVVAQPTASIILDGHLRLANGGGLIFPDGSVQSSATVQGPPGPQGQKGDAGATGPAGPQGPPGVAYVKTAVVSPAGTPAENGAALLSALAGLTASSTNPALLKIEPGYYDLSGSTLTMKPFLDIQGSGSNVTVITSAVSTADNGVINGGDNAEIRFLTINNSGTGAQNIAVFNNGASPKISNVTITVLGNGSINYGIWNSYASPVITGVDVISSGAANSNYGLLNQNSSPTMTNCRVTASGGSEDCRGIANLFSSPVIRGGSVVCSGSSYTNDAIHNASYSSPSISDVSVSAAGGLYTRGISNFQSSPVLRNITATASGAIHSNWGLYFDNSTPVVNDLTAAASGGLNAAGIEVTSCSFTMSNVTAKGTGATNNYGVHTFAYSGSNTLAIDRSTLEGSTNSIYNNDYLTVQIGASKLVGNINAAGTFRCVNVYNGQYSLLGNDCK